MNRGQPDQDGFSYDVDTFFVQFNDSNSDVQIHPLQTKRPNHPPPSAPSEDKLMLTNDILQ
jgi:hypothetical protein